MSRITARAHSFDPINEICSQCGLSRTQVEDGPFGMRHCYQPERDYVRVTYAIGTIQSPEVDAALDRSMART